jgi:hypothetical protein
METEIKYTVEYFINKFEAIPEENWCTLSFMNGNAKCAYGHCGVFNRDTFESKHTPESSALTYLTTGQPIKSDDIICAVIDKVNDGDHKDYPQPTPKQPVLAFLYDLKAKETPFNDSQLAEMSALIPIVNYKKEGELI